MNKSLDKVFYEIPYRKTDSIVFIANSKWSENKYLKSPPNEHAQE